jgi:hypothetical protein
VAVVLSGGGINGVLLELGFLRRLSETDSGAGSAGSTEPRPARSPERWRRSTASTTSRSSSSGSHPRTAFRPRPIWQFPGGLHDYTLPATIADRIGPPEVVGAKLAASPIELLVFATDVSEYPQCDEERDFELVYSSHSTEPETMGRAILASAAISGIVLPLHVGEKIATDGGWVRNFPFEHAYRNPDVAAIAAFRYVPTYPVSDGAFLERARERLELFRAVPPVRALLAELRLAQERAAAASRPTTASCRPPHARRLRAQRGRGGAPRGRARDVRRRAPVTQRRRAPMPPWPRAALAPQDAARAARRAVRGRALPVPPRAPVETSIVRGTSGPESLDPTFRGDIPWPEERKRALIDRGYTLTDDALEQASMWD